MGIPAFYRWLTEKYPLITADVMEETPLLINGVSVPLDTSCPNPNGIEFDNLYLDMNGIIHPCFHPEGLPPPTTYEEVFAAVFKYIDRIFSIVRPRKLLFMAIDGVAPRAKMNQQRSRRFRAARDAADQALSIETDGGIVPESEEGNLEQVKKLDSNVITPGTEFMDLLSSALHYYIRLRMKEDLGWRGIKVILSDANVAGEGEHKIMSYIRLQRNLPGFDPNTRHCLYGLDADLIMLALASHEIHFSILREDLGNARTGGKSLKEKRRLMKRRKLNGDSEQVGKFAENIENYISGMKFQFLNVWILREYLAYDLTIPDTTLKLDVERVIDDFVFMCLFVGNDFLPHIPSLEISEGALNLLMTVYKKEFAQMGGYLTNSFEINLIRVEHFVQALGSHESAIFRRRNQMQKEREIRFQRISKHQQAFHSSKSLFDDGVSESCKSSVKLETAPLSQNRQNPRSMAIKESNHFSSNGTSAVVDKIKLGDEGWKERYYAEKFEAKSEEERDTIRRHAVFKYVEGICWVMRYYYEGVCSWQWFYPYHYAPFASDFYGCDQLEIHFTLGEPFKPFDQLMAVLPAASAHALPLFYRKLMIDASSPILDFYPTDFELDNNGKRFSWQAICKLPFIEESRLVSEITKVEHTLTDEERRRNRLGYDVLCVHVSHPLAVKVISLFECKDQSALPTANGKLKIDPKISGGMNGYIYISEKPEWPLGIFSPIDGMLMIASEQVISVFYEYPPFHSHIPRLPEGVILPNKSVTRCNILHVHHLWHEPAIPGSISSKRQIPKSISGPQLAELAHRLVSEYSSSKHLDFHRCAERGLPLDAARMGEMGTQVQPKKRKRGKRNKNCLDGRSKESQVGKGDFVPINNVKNMESSTLRQQGESCGGYGSAGVDEIKIEKSKKRKRSSKNKEGAEGAGIPDGVQKLERSIQEQRNSDHTSGGADGENDYKEEKSRKRKSRKRKKKGNQNDGDAVQNKNAEKLGCCNHHISKLQSCILQEQSGGDVHEGGDVALELKTDVESKKRRKIEADGVLINNVEKLESCFLMGQRGGDSNHTNADGLDATSNPVPNNNHQELEDGALELKTELKSKKKKRRSKKRRKIEADGVLINNVEKLKSCLLMGQRGGDSNHTNADGLDATSNPVPNNNHQELEDGALELKTELKSKKKRRRSKKRKKIEADGVVLINNVEKLESCFLMGQRGGDSNHTNADGLDATSNPVPNNNHQELEDGALELKTELKSKKKRRRSKKRRKIEADGILINNVEKLGSSPMEQRGGDSKLTNADGLDPTRRPVPNKINQELEGSGPQEQIEHFDHSGANEVEIKPEVKSKRKKRRSKKKRQIELIVPPNDPPDSGLPGKQGTFDSNHTGVGGLEMKTEV
ncbi:5'-3' exoribonuclease 4-like isoform X1 [Populus alba x Populus x berolinensis]|uniref:5'-3' exoribonuclease 4-like isoform X1 n=1 Tax=Populus alba x Populus x berolinensis TaxID=444605 RepID=A0AAD6Q0W9_9ROSI|nr:5'-3' exoribonuclease 4-like isoform X1 [Populus alba x Populus x berolinensis]